MARPGSPSYDGLPPRAYSGVVSIGITPGSGGGSSSGSPIYGPGYWYDLTIGHDIDPYGRYRGTQSATYRPFTQEEKALVFLGTTVLGPLSLGFRGAAAANTFYKGWKLRQAVLAGQLLVNLDSTGGGGPSETPTSTKSPLSLEQIGKASEHTSTLAAAGNSAHGGRRSGSKPRKRCPPGFYWNGHRCVKR